MVCIFDEDVVSNDFVGDSRYVILSAILNNSRRLFKFKRRKKKERLYVN